MTIEIPQGVINRPVPAGMSKEAIAALILWASVVLAFCMWLHMAIWLIAVFLAVTGGMLTVFLRYQCRNDPDFLRIWMRQMRFKGYYHP